MAVASPSYGRTATRTSRRALSMARPRASAAARVRAAVEPLVVPIVVLAMLSTPVVCRLSGVVKMNTENRRTLNLKREVGQAQEGRHRWEAALLRARARERVRRWAEANGMMRPPAGSLYVAGVGLNSSR